MLRLNRFNSIQDIIQWEENLPDCGVSIVYKRNPDGSDFYTCTSSHANYSSQRVFMNTEELLNVCLHAETFISHNITKPSGLVGAKVVISQSVKRKPKQLTIEFSMKHNIIRMAVRVWRAD